VRPSMDHRELLDIVEREWRDVLGVDTADDADNFFELGGDSLRAVELVERVEAASGRAFPIEALFVEGTLGAVKTALESDSVERPN
jgi:acyl carrier protein